jgi:hypothetical protein
MQATWCLGFVTLAHACFFNVGVDVKLWCALVLLAMSSKGMCMLPSVATRANRTPKIVQMAEQPGNCIVVENMLLVAEIKGLEHVRGSCLGVECDQR